MCAPLPFADLAPFGAGVIKAFRGGNPEYSTSSRAVTYIGANVLACGFRGSLKCDLPKQFGMPLAVGGAGHEFVIGDQQIRSNIVDGCSPLVDYFGGVEIIPRRGPHAPAGLPKLTGRGSEIALQTLRDPGDRHRCHSPPGGARCLKFHRRADMATIIPLKASGFVGAVHPAPDGANHKNRLASRTKRRLRAAKQPRGTQVRSGSLKKLLSRERERAPRANFAPRKGCAPRRRHAG